MTAYQPAERPSLLTMTELVLDPIDDALGEGSDPLDVARHPGVLEHWQALGPRDQLATLAAQAWDAREYPLPRSKADPEAAAYAAVLHTMASRAGTRAMVAYRIADVGLPARAGIGLGASLLLLAAIRAAVTAYDTTTCTQCGQLWRDMPPARQAADSRAPSRHSHPKEDSMAKKHSNSSGTRPPNDLDHKDNANVAKQAQQRADLVQKMKDKTKKD